MSYLTIGSGDVGKLLQGIKTKGYADLWRKFLSENPPYYNALASPIDALRTGAILEDCYMRHLDDQYYPQVKATCESMDVFKSSIDFAFIDGDVKDFDELKTVFLPDFIEVVKLISKESNYQEIIKKKFKQNYLQVQFQLLCTGLEECNLVFLSVENYNDEENKIREITDNDIVKFRINRDDEVIFEITERGKIFQQVKDHFNEI